LYTLFAGTARVLLFFMVEPGRLIDMQNANANAASGSQLDLACRLAGDLAHELNNLITPVISCGQLLEESPDPDDVTFCAGQLKDAGERMQALAKKLQMIGSRQPSTGTTAVVEWLDAAVGTVRLPDQHPPAIVASYRERVFAAAATVDIQPAHAAFVAEELLRNAIEAMPSGGSITLDVEDAGDAIVLVVTDQGCGIPPGIRERIFDPYFTTRSKARDRGLGLTMVYGVVRRAGGSIEYVPATETGSTFRVRLRKKGG
jgi:two-component system cell cycle sensor histidine kinase/response regulator CckA